MKDKEQIIDFIVYWVDGNDPEWQCELKQYKKIENEGSKVQRYRDWDNQIFIFQYINIFLRHFSTTRTWQKVT